MQNSLKLSEINFLNDTYYSLYQRGKRGGTWDCDLNWGLALNDHLPNTLKDAAITVASLSAHTELLSMDNAAKMLMQASDFSLRLSLAQTISDEARHAEVFSRYALLANGKIKDLSITVRRYTQHFNALTTFDEILLSHVILENSALEQFNIFIQAFSEQSLIGKIYQGVLLDETRHVQLGLNYFRQLIKHTPTQKEMVINHLATFNQILHLSHDGAEWLAAITGLSPEEIGKRMHHRENDFINKIMGNQHS